MASGTELDIGRLTTPVTQIDLPQGRIYLRVRQLDGSHTFEIAIPRGGVLLLQPGVYDIDSGSEDQPARVAVFEAAARFAGNGVDIEIKTGRGRCLERVQSGHRQREAARRALSRIERAVADAFVEWCRLRD
jgi:hypothetical protein